MKRVSAIEGVLHFWEDRAEEQHTASVFPYFLVSVNLVLSKLVKASLPFLSLAAEVRHYSCRLKEQRVEEKAKQSAQ